MSVTDKDNGYRALAEQVFGIERPKISVGIHEAEAAHANGKVTVGDIATWNEFGTRTIPARSFIRAFVDEKQDEIRATAKGLLLQVVRGKLTKEQALDQLGLWLQGQIQRRMAEGIPPPNAEATIEKKGSSTPLIDTGALRSAVTFKVHEG